MTLRLLHYLGVLSAIWTLAAVGCVRTAPMLKLDDAAESYVRLVLALGERDGDSLDSYYGPPAWAADARRRGAALSEIDRDARQLADRLVGTDDRSQDETRRAFLVRQLRAISARVGILRGERPAFDDEAVRLFGLHATTEPADATAIRRALDRELPGGAPLATRLAAFDRAFVVPTNRLPAVVARAMAECRAVTAALVPLQADDTVEVTYVPDSAWSAYTRHLGGFRSRVQINASLPLTVDRVVDLACHEAYPGHHLIYSLVEQQFAGRVERFVQPTFSPQSALQESAAAGAGALVFSDAERLAFERDVLFPLAGLDPSGAARHVRVSRLVDGLHGVEAAIARQYLDGALDFPRAAQAFEDEALMASPDVTLKFLNQFRSYAATYTIGRDRFWSRVSTMSRNGDVGSRWRAYIALVTSGEQTVE